MKIIVCTVLALALVLSAGLVMTGPLSTPVAAAAGPPVDGGLVLHLDASAIEGLDDGAAVEQWDDLSGEGNDATQAEVDKQPLWVDDVLDGKPVIRFDGANTYMVTGAHDPVAGQPNTVFVVWSVRGLTGDHQFAIDGIDGSNRHLVRWHGDFGLGGWAGNPDLNYEKDAPFDHMITSVIFDGDESKMYEDGEWQATDDAGTQAYGGLSIGSRRDGARKLDGDIAEILIYDRALSEGERQGVERYLGMKWLGWPAPDEVWVCEATGSNDNPGTEDYPFATIQRGIDVVADGGTVNVKAGTYVEAGQIVIDKDLTIVGEDRDTTIIKPAQDTGSTGDARGWFLVEAGNEFKLSNVTLDGEGKKVHQAVRSFGSGTIHNNIIKNMIYATHVGIGVVVMGDDNMTVSNNVLTNFGRIGIMAFGPGVTNAQFTGNIITGKGPGEALDYGIDVGGGAFATITGNTISNCGPSTSAWASAAIMLDELYAPAKGTGGADITGNTLVGNEIGVFWGYDENCELTGTIEDNTFVDNRRQVRDRADYLDLDDVLADNDFDRAVVVRGSPIVVPTIFSSIQDAIDAASDGETVEVHEGTYTEDVLVQDKWLTISGTENSPLPTVEGSITINQAGLTDPDPTVIEYLHFVYTDPASGHYNSIYIISADNITIRNCSFDGAGRFMDQPYSQSAINVIRSSGITLDSCVIENGFYMAIYAIAGAPGVNNLTVRDCTFDNIKSGVNLNEGDNLVVENTDISIVAQANDSHSYGVRFATNNPNFGGEDMTITGGTFTVDRAGFEADPGTYHAAIVLRAAAAGDMKVSDASILGEVVNLTNPEILDARYNWWGYGTGPYHDDTNLAGEGGPVTDNVLFDPWWANEDMTVPGSNLPVYNETRGTFHNTIQDAIDAAEPGDTIHVTPGTYSENVILNKHGITLVSNPGAVLEGDGTGNGILINAADATIDGFEIKNYAIGIRTYGGPSNFGDLSVLDCNIHSNTQNGILIVFDEFNDVIIQNCQIENNTQNGIGISDDAKIGHLLINPSTVSGNGHHGLYIAAGATIEEMTVTDTDMIGNGHSGVTIDTDSNVSNATFTDCNITGSDVNFVVRFDATVTDLAMVGCSLSDSPTNHGFHLKDATINGLSFDNVTMADNRYQGFFVSDGATLTDATFTGCSITGNDINVAVTGADTTVTGLTMVDCTLSDSPTNHGFHLRDGTIDGLLFDNVTMANNKEQGFFVSNDATLTDATISGGAIRDNAWGLLTQDSTVTNLTLDGVTVENNTWGSGVSVASGTVNGLTVKNCSFHNHAWEHIDIGVEWIGAVTVTNVLITGNTFGTGPWASVFVAPNAVFGTTDISVRFNNFESGEWGVFYAGNPQVVDATHNWWGDASGPEHENNPGGTGDAVSDHVNYEHWLGAPLDLPAVYHDTLPEGPHEIDARDQADTTVEFETTGATEIYIALYESQPFPDEAFPDETLGKYVDIHVSDPGNVVWPVYVRVYYTAAEVNAAGIDERTLGLYYYSLEDGGFHRCSDTGVNTAEKFVWANITEEEAGYLAGSPFGTGGEPVPPPQPPTAGAPYPVWAVLLAGLAAGTSLLLLRRRAQI